MVEVISRQRVRFIRVPEMNNLELLHVAYTKHQFSPHFHGGHVIGVIEKGLAIPDV